MYNHNVVYGDEIVHLPPVVLGLLVLLGDLGLTLLLPLPMEQ